MAPVDPTSTGARGGVLDEREALDATNRAQRRRSAALVVLMLGVAALGVGRGALRTGTTPAPCPTPGLADGALVCDGTGGPPGARAWLAGGKLDVNAATAAELEQIPGVGASLAARIVETRTARGRFSAIEELDEVQGVGPKTVDKLRAVLEVRTAPGGR